MIRKFALSVLFVLPLSVFAQDLKFGHINRQELIEVMPEAVAAQRTLEDLVLKYREEMTKLETEFQSKLTDLQQNSAALEPAIRARRESDLQRMHENIQSFGTNAQEDLQKRQMELMIPIEEKVNKAINEIGEENGFMYIFDVQAQAILYKSSKSVDVLPMVKKKLNLK